MKTDPFRWLVAAVMLTLPLPCFAQAAQDPDSKEIIRQLQRRIEELESKVKALEKSSAPNTPEKEALDELEQKVRVLERNRELELETSEVKSKQAPKITLGGDGFGFGSADGQFGVQLKGVLQVDSRTFLKDSGTRGNDGFLLRRARPILQGRLWNDFDFLFVPEFGGNGSPQVFDAYVNYRYKPELQLRAGKFKVPLGLEQLQADVDTLFNERSLVTTMVPNRDLGVQLHGDVGEGMFSYAAGIFNGVGDARNSSNVDFGDNKSFAGRIFFHPFTKASATLLRGLGVGVGGTYEEQDGANAAGLPATTGGNVPGYTTDGQQQYFSYSPGSNAVIVAEGTHWRVSPQAYYYYGPLGFLAEYVITDQEVRRTVAAPQVSSELDHRSWQLTGSWILTGEPAAFKGGVSPRKRFNPAAGGWGALQLVARYEQAHLDESAFPLFANPNDSAHEAAAWSVGLNWYLNRNLLFKTSFSQTRFEGGGGAGATGPASVTRNNENVLFTRIQLAF